MQLHRVSSSPLGTLFIYQYKERLKTELKMFPQEYFDCVQFAYTSQATFDLSCPNRAVMFNRKWLGCALPQAYVRPFSNPKYL